MSRVNSKDGTSIAITRSGHGPPLVLVHGVTADHDQWAPILPQIERHWTVYALDRRGRGASDDASSYAIEKEFDDVAAVVDSIGAPVDLLGHSFGGLCSLEGATRTNRVRKLALYEPPIRTSVPIYPPGWIDRLQELLDGGDRASVVTTFFREVVHTPDGELVMLQSLPNWPARVASAHTIPRELRAAQTYRFDPARFAGLRMPTLLLVGGDSPAFFRNAIDALHAAIATSQVAVMPGQQHAAMQTAPELFTHELLAFFGM